MRKCVHCGGKLRRVHRTFWQRFTQMAMYECKGCRKVDSAPRRYTFHFGPECRCPKCGTYRVSCLKERDQIDPFHHGFLGFVERLRGGRLHHCRYCRVQFFDRRPLASESKRSATADTNEAASS